MPHSCGEVLDASTSLVFKWLRGTFKLTPGGEFFNEFQRREPTKNP